MKMTTAAIIVTLSTITSLSTYATVVHNAGIPTGLDANFKTSSTYIYLEAETSTQGASDTLASADVGHTFYRTSVSPTDNWSSQSAYDSVRYAVRGSDSGSYSNVNVYWENITATLPAGSYDIYVRAFPSTNGTQTFTLSAADSIANLASGVTSTSLTTSTTYAGTARWYRIGSVDLTAGTDSFGLTIGTSTSTVRFDSVLLVGPAAAVPEPSSLLVMGLPVLSLLVRRR